MTLTETIPAITSSTEYGTAPRPPTPLASRRSPDKRRLCCSTSPASVRARNPRHRTGIRQPVGRTLARGPRSPLSTSPRHDRCRRGQAPEPRDPCYRCSATPLTNASFDPVTLEFSSTTPRTLAVSPREVHRSFVSADGSASRCGTPAMARGLRHRRRPRPTRRPCRCALAAKSQRAARRAHGKLAERSFAVGARGTLRERSARDDPAGEQPSCARPGHRGIRASSQGRKTTCELPVW